MWKIIRPMLPHAGILLGNVTMVLFVLEQINPSMNFIDNPLTKGLLVIMALVSALIRQDCVAYQRRRARKTRKKRGMPGLLPAISLGLCAACVILVPLDGIFPAWNLFLLPVFQWLIALNAVALIAVGGALASRDRSRLRRRALKQRG